MVENIKIKGNYLNFCSIVFCFVNQTNMLFFLFLIVALNTINDLDCKGIPNEDGDEEITKSKPRWHDLECEVNIKFS